MTLKGAIFLFCFTVFSCTIAIGQNNSIADSVNVASAKLLMSITENKSGEEIAGNYFTLAQALTKAGDYSKAELYMNKAIQLELKDNKSTRISEYYRELAKILELQNKFEAAADNFEKAAAVTEDNAQKQLNKNDAGRLRHKSSPQLELQYLNQNNAILNNSGKNAEIVQNLSQLATTNIALNQNDAALENYKAALIRVDSASEQSILIKSGMVNLMVAGNDVGNAIVLQKEIVSQSQGNTNVSIQVEQLRNLSALYFKLDSTQAGLKMLHDAYQLALAKGNVKEAKSSLKSLAAYYEQHKEDKEALKLYTEFVSQLEPLIARDSSLIDKSLFLINEGKIVELEQQQALKDELLQGKNRSNYVLIGSVFLLSVLLLLIVKAWFSIRKRNKQIALQSLRREMNPHFIFNSLNSVNQFIANNNEREANKYLTSYSNLMRNIMENSNKDYVTLNDEIDQLKKYLELEKMRFTDKFEYQLTI
ncbi:MAG: histidine kinase, partial [Bacteroidota bacterium]|nr:histidine kinase [Bacteroidota bacterium]